jgi:hypothetical protein
MVYSSESNTCVQAIWYVIVMKWLIEPAAVALAIIIVIVAIVLFGAFYFRASQPALVTPTPVPETATVTEIPATIPTALPETTQPTPETTTPPPTPTTPHGNYAVAATPIRDPNYYKLPYYSTVYDPRGKMPPTIFHQSYQFNFQYEAVVANIVQAPLIIDFAVSPGSSSPIRSFFLITVRENSTQKLLAQDGYFRTYSSNSPKRLIFSSPGTYHINMYGSFVSADLTLRAPT